MARGYNQFMQGLIGKVGGVVVTTNGEETIMRKRIYRNTSDTPAQQQTRANISGLANIWAALSPTHIAGWVTLGGQMSSASGTSSLSGYQAFVSINGLLLACGQPTVDAAPTAPALPAPLPPLMVTAATLPHGAPQPWSLSIASAAYSGLVQVYAAAPASAGRHSFSRSQFKLITALTALTVGDTDLTAAYTDFYGVPGTGRKIALRLIPVSATGFRGNAIEPTTLVAAPGLDALSAQPALVSTRKAA